MMSEKEWPLVSVLMTAYNREQYIAEAIESVLASTYTKFELIIVDDYSTDNTVQIASSFLKDTRVRVYVNGSNLQQFANRNKAAEYAQGKYLKYVDSDDILYSHSLEMMVHIMEANPECALGFCHYSGNSKFPIPHRYSQKEIVSEHYFEGGILFTGPIGTIIRRDAFETVGGFELFGMPSDNHFSLKIASKYPVVSMYRDLIWWRIHDGQAFSGATDDVNIFNNLKWNLDILTNMNCPLNEEDRLRVIKNFKIIFIRNLVNGVIRSPKKITQFNKMLKTNKISLLSLVKEIL